MKPNRLKTAGSLGWIIAAALICGGVAGSYLGLTHDLPQIRSLEAFRPAGVTRIYSADDHLLAELFVEKRDPIPLAMIPEHLKAALIATEDRNFFRHSGLDLKGIARALIRDIQHRRFVEGASTITQQLAKTLFLTPRKSLIRKLKEAILAIQLERRYTKNEILTFYLNQIYFGSGAYGVESAARIYFSKSVNRLDLAECALIAGLPKAPSRYSPLVNPELALKRRNLVLLQMQQAGLIEAARYRAAIQRPYQPPVAGKTSVSAPYFIDFIRHQLESSMGPKRLYSGGLTVKTTLNFHLQAAAETAVSKGLAALDARMAARGVQNPVPQCALVALDVRSGGILAMVGGRNNTVGTFNRASAARRQSGSAFKPIIYAYAIEQGYSQNDTVLDAPVTYQGANPGDLWQPQNFSKDTIGEISLRKAIAESRNIPAVRLLEELGLSSVSQFAHTLGISTPLANNLSLALGTSETTIIDLTAAYAVFPNSGRRSQPHGVIEVLDHQQRVHWRVKPSKRVVMSRVSAAITTDMLKAVVQEGTASRAKTLGPALAGKTGTTDKFRDALFVGFSPSIVAGVWVGRDDFSTLGPGETGARAALPIWMDFMATALNYESQIYFDFPDNAARIHMDPITGRTVESNWVGGVQALVRKPE